MAGTRGPPLAEVEVGALGWGSALPGGHLGNVQGRPEGPGKGPRDAPGREGLPGDQASSRGAGRPRTQGVHGQLSDATTGKPESRPANHRLRLRLLMGFFYRETLVPRGTPAALSLPESSHVPSVRPRGPVSLGAPTGVTGSDAVNSFPPLELWSRISQWLTRERSRHNADS